MSQIFGVRLRQVLYDEDARVFWFNRSSLENERRSNSSASSSGSPSTTASFWTCGFPHVLYKIYASPSAPRRLKRRPCASPWRAPARLRGDGASVESTFGLCMQVCYVEFGETKTRDWLPGGGDVQ